MVDTESPICPLSPLEPDDLESPLSEEFLQEMGNIQEISQSIGEDSSGSFSFTEYQYLGSGPGSDGSVITGKCAAPRKLYLEMFFPQRKLFSLAGKEVTSFCSEILGHNTARCPGPLGLEAS